MKGINEKIDNILSNIKSIGYYLASKKDMEANDKFHKDMKSKKKVLVSDVKDLKLSALQSNIDALREGIEEMGSRPILKIRIFVASSNKLEEEREMIERLIAYQNDKIVDQGIYLNFNIWEKASMKFNPTRKQKDFNEELVNKSEIFICLIGDSVGKFTKEEFNRAKNRFDKGQKPYVFYVYFKNFEKQPEGFYTSKTYRKVTSLKNYIEKLEQYYGTFKNEDDLARQIERHLAEDIKDVKKKKNEKKI